MTIDALTPFRWLQPPYGDRGNLLGEIYCVAWLAAHEDWLLIADDVTHPDDAAPLLARTRAGHGQTGRCPREHRDPRAGRQPRHARRAA